MKKFILFISLILIFTVGVTNYFIDPYQFFRKSDIYFKKQQRFQNPGLAKHQDYNAVIIGDATVDNMTSALAEKYFPGKFLKLGIEGSTLYEQQLILKTALSTGKVSFVLWNLSPFYLTYDIDAVRFDGDFPYYLYESNIISDIRYMLNLKIFKTSIKMVKHPEALNITTDLENLDTWYEEVKQYFDRHNVLADYYLKAYLSGVMDINGQWDEADKSRLIKENKMALQLMNENISANMVKIITANPDVEFKIYFTPVSVLWNKHSDNIGTLENQLQNRQFTFEKLGHLKNVEIFDFQSVEEITADLDNYKDMSHYSPKVDEFILSAISKGDYRVDNMQVLKMNQDALKRQMQDYKPEIIDLTYLQKFKKNN